MAITREQKEQQVGKLADDFANAKMTVLADYKGLSVGQVQQLRKELKASGSSMRVVKNTLVRLAAAKHPAFKDLDTSVFDGSVALVFGQEDEVAPAQVVANFAKQHQLPQYRRLCSVELFHYLFLLQWYVCQQLLSMGMIQYGFLQPLE